MQFNGSTNWHPIFFINYNVLYILYTYIFFILYFYTDKNISFFINIWHEPIIKKHVHVQRFKWLISKFKDNIEREGII